MKYQKEMKTKEMGEIKKKRKRNKTHSHHPPRTLPNNKNPPLSLSPIPLPTIPTTKITRKIPPNSPPNHPSNRLTIPAPIPNQRTLRRNIPAPPFVGRLRIDDYEPLLVREFMQTRVAVEVLLGGARAVVDP